MTTIIDAWMQFPNRVYLLDPMFDSLRLWPTHWRRLAEDDPDVSHDRVNQLFADHEVARIMARGGVRPGR